MQDYKFTKTFFVQVAEYPWYIRVPCPQNDEDRHLLRQFILNALCELDSAVRPNADPSLLSKFSQHVSTFTLLTVLASAGVKHVRLTTCGE